jgi:hypothetical protein
MAADVRGRVGACLVARAEEARLRGSQVGSTYADKVR